MKILIVFATYSGSTRIVGDIIKATLKKDNDVTSCSVFDFNPEGFKDFDFIVLGSNSWFEKKEEGQMNSGFHALKEKLKPDSLKGKKFAIYALGDSNLYHNTFCKAADHLEKLVREFGGDAVIPPLKVNSFYFDEEGNEPKIIEWSEGLNQFLKLPQSR